MLHLPPVHHHPGMSSSLSLLSSSVSLSSLSLSSPTRCVTMCPRRLASLCPRQCVTPCLARDALTWLCPGARQCPGSNVQRWLHTFNVSIYIYLNDKKPLGANPELQTCSPEQVLPGAQDKMQLREIKPERGVTSEGFLKEFGFFGHLGINMKQSSSLLPDKYPLFQLNKIWW